MQGDYAEPQGEPSAMFSKLHNPQPQSFVPFSHPFQLSARNCQNPEEEEEEEEEEGERPCPATRTPSKKPVELSSGDGSTIEVLKRPRGRPPGSKNKPKPAAAVAPDPELFMSSYILEVTGGSDVIGAIARFCCRKNIGLTVLSGSGAVSDVTIRPSTGAPMMFPGRFDIISISATFLPNSTAFSVPNGFVIYLAGTHGHIFGGLVCGELIADGTVFVIASSFNNPSYHRLPDEDVAGNSADAIGGEKHSSPGSVAGDSGGHTPAQSRGMLMYGSHVSSNVVWAPTARPPFNGDTSR